jgi:hypothetical protein
MNETFDADSYLNSTSLNRISIQELRALASDRGYEINDMVSDRVYRNLFMQHQLADKSLDRTPE